MNAKSWTPLMWFYLLMSVLGAIVPWYFNGHQLLYGTQPFTLANYLAAGLANDFTSSITTDFLIVVTSFIVWMIVESRRLKMKGIGWYILFTFLIAIAFTCPLFLLNRERKIQAMKGI
jgi:hypothetical protein